MPAALPGGLVARTAARTRPRFAPPRSARGPLRRAHLDKAIASGIETGVLFVVAAAGYGKTTAVSEWFASSGLPVAWLSLNTAHRNPPALLNDLIEALAHLHPTVDALRTQLEAGDGPQAIADQLTALLHALDDADDFGGFVLDDVHALHDADPANAILDELCAHSPSSLALVLIGRERPAFPSLARGVASGRMALIDARALAFRDDEARALLETLGTPEAARDQLIARAQGWPLALALLGRRAVDAPTHGAASQIDTTDLDEFIRSEVFDPLPPDDRALLQACSVAAYFDGDIAAEVSERSDSAVALQGLRVRTGLISPVGDGRWLRMHPLLREHCLQRLAREDPARLAAYRSRAARALKRAGELDEATELALDGESWADARELIEAQAEALSGRGAWSTLASWLSRLPSHVLADAPDLTLLRARVAIRLMRLAEAHTFLDEVQRQTLAPRDQARALLYRGIAHRQARRLDAALAAQRSARVIIEETEPLDSDLRIEVDFEEGSVHGMRGEIGPALQLLQQAAAAAERSGHPRFAANAHQNLGMALLIEGRLAPAGEAFREARRRWEVLGEQEAVLLSRNNEATVAHMLGNLAGAETAYRNIAEHAAPRSRMAALATVGLADIARDRHQLEAAERGYEAALELAIAIEHRGVEAAAAFGLAMVAIERGDSVAARRLIEEHLRSTEEQGARDFAARFRIGLARLLITEHRCEDALATTTAVLDSPGRGFQRQQVALLVRADAQFQLGLLEAAITTLTALFDLVEAVGYDQFIVTEARFCTELLSHHATAAIGTGYFARLLERAQRHPVAARVVAASPSPHAAEALPSSVDLVVRAFGSPTVVRPQDGPSEVAWRSERSKELFLLLLTRDGPITREEAEASIWPDTPAQQLSSLFHNNLHRLRRSVGQDAVIRVAGGYAVNPALSIDFDVRRFEAHLAAAEAEGVQENPTVRESELRSAFRLYTGSFARTFESDWAVDLRAHLEDRFVAAASSLARLDIARSNFTDAVEVAEAVLNLDPLNEEAVRHLIAAHVGMGFPDLALRAYRRLQELTERDLGAPPSAETLRALELGLARSQPTG